MPDRHPEVRAKRASKDDGEIYGLSPFEGRKSGHLRVTDQENLCSRFLSRKSTRGFRLFAFDGEGPDRNHVAIMILFAALSHCTADSVLLIGGSHADTRSP